MKSDFCTGRRPGITFGRDRTTVLLWAPFARQVILHNETTGDQWELQTEEKGYWSSETDGICCGDRYFFSMDGGSRLPDPASLAQPDGVHGASQVIDLKQFLWTDQNTKLPDPEDYIIYELHTGTFSERGDFEGIMERLDYLKALGITAIELMPVAQFPGKRNWGYDGVFPFAVQESYGGAMALQELVNACHSKGLAVILDVVYNHLGPEGNYFENYGPYFTDKYKTPWGKAINFDDAWCDPVREFFISNALMWFGDFHIDALRLDAVHAIKDFSPRHIIQEMADLVDAYGQQTGLTKSLIVECDLNDRRFIDNKLFGGYGVRAQWNDDFHHTLRVAAGQMREGYYADFNGIEDLAKVLKEAYVYDGRYSKQRHRNFGSSAKGIPGDRFIVFSQNHDQIGNRMRGERTASLLSFEMLKLLSSVVLCSPYIPLLFMGEEWGATTPFPYFIDHSDKALLEAVAKGRQEEFRQFQPGKTPLPAHEEFVYLSAKLDWKEQRTDSHLVLWKYYQELIRLRKLYPALRNYDLEAVDVFCDGSKQVLILERSYKEQLLYCVFNFSDEPKTIRLKEEVFPLHILLSSSGKSWNGKGKTDILHNKQSSILMQPESFLLLSNHYVPS